MPLQQRRPAKVRCGAGERGYGGWALSLRRTFLGGKWITGCDFVAGLDTARNRNFFARTPRDLNWSLLKRRAMLHVNHIAAGAQKDGFSRHDDGIRNALE